MTKRTPVRISRRSGLAALTFCVLASASALAAWTPSGAAGDLIVLQGDQLRAHIAPQRGGGMVGLEYRYKGQWIELLYRGMDFSPTSDWDGKAPILWPATGRNAAIDPATNAKKPGWISNGTFYPMPIHGFARDLPWTVAGQTETAAGKTVTLSLGDSPETRKLYPFGFKVTTTYTVGKNTVTIRQQVHAAENNAGPMPFSIGNHMTYNVPLVPGGDAGAVTFDTPATKRLLLDDGGIPTGASEPFAHAAPLPLTQLGTRKAWSLTGFPKDAWVKVIDPSGLTLTVSHRDSRSPAGDPVFFNLWGDPQGGFFSPEPWAGKQNSLVTQDGTVRLDPGAEFEWTIVVTLN
jgi:galactose mutarotase-like enzyme